MVSLVTVRTIAFGRTVLGTVARSEAIEANSQLLHFAYALWDRHFGKHGTLKMAMTFTTNLALTFRIRGRDSVYFLMHRFSIGMFGLRLFRRDRVARILETLKNLALTFQEKQRILVVW